MTEQLDSASDYVPIHRIAVACRSCRRKKARCTGDQPACGNCRRLRIGQTCYHLRYQLSHDTECIYSADTTKSETSSTTAQQNSTESPSPGDLASILTRLSSIEETLQVFGSHIQSIRSDLDFLVGHQPPKRPMEEETQHQSRKKQLIDHDDPTPSIQDLSKEHTLPATEGSFLPREVTLAIIDAYFTYCHNQPYCFFHEASFRLQFSLGNIPKHLLSAVLATAIRFSAHPYFTNRVNDVANEYANHSWKLVVANCFATSQPPNVSLVQTLCLLGLFDFTAGKSRHAAAWVKSGLAVRMAQELGLMQDAAPEVSIYVQEERRRVFWSVYLLDRLISCGRGRPLAVLDASCPLQLPSTDQAWRDGSVEIAPTLDTLTNRQSETCNALSPFAHVVAAASLLGRSIQYSLQQCNLHGRCPPWDPRSDFAALESDLLHLELINGVQAPVEELLGSYVTAENGIDQPGVSPVIISRIIFHLSYCLLNHPFLLRQRLASSKVTPPSSFLARAFDTAWRHACHMIELVRSARKHGYVLTASSSGYCIMVAGSIIALNKHSEDSYISAQAESLLQDVIAALDSLGRYWYNVSNMVPALQLVMERSAELYELSSPKAQVVDLTSPDSDLMWSVVDYGSISNSSIAECGQNNVSTPDLWFESFYNLFGAQHSGNEPEYLDLTMDPFSIVPL